MSDEKKTAVCALCGEPMPPGETMFKYHGYSGPCPKPPLPKPPPIDKDALIRDLQQQLKTAREALEPFALVGELAHDDRVMTEGQWAASGMRHDFIKASTRITHGDFRRAAAAIRSLGEKE